MRYALSFSLVLATTALGDLDLLLERERESDPDLYRGNEQDVKKSEGMSKMSRRVKQ